MNTEKFNLNDKQISELLKLNCNAKTFEQAIDWFAEQHKLHAKFDWFFEDTDELLETISYDFSIQKIGDKTEDGSYDDYIRDFDYESAEILSRMQAISKALDYLISYVNQNDK